MRVRLFKLAADEHVLVLNLHHIVADGMSTGLLLAELDACYRAATGGAGARLPDLGVQYPDFAHWQREASRERNSLCRPARDLAQAVGRHPARAGVARRPPRPALQSFAGSNVFFDMPATLAEELKRSRRRKVHVS